MAVPSCSDSSGELSFTAGYPNEETAATLYDELDYQRAVQAYIWAVPLVNSVAFKKALLTAGVDPSTPSLLIFDHQLTPKQIIMTANSEVLYAFTILDLAQTGPVVVEAPQGVLGGMWDFWERGLVDIGTGSSRDGGKFLVLSPGYDGDIPDDYFIVRGQTTNVFIAGRGILKPGDSTEPFVELLSTVKISPYAQRDAPPPTTIIRNGDRPFDSDWPKDARFFAYLAEGLSAEVIQPEDKLMYAMLEPLGIVPGQPFTPDERIAGILARAAETGAGMVRTMAFHNRFPGRQLWPERQWEPITFATTPDFVTEQRVELDERAQGWYQLVGNGVYIYSATPAPGEGSWYVSTFHDVNGAYLNGSKSYRLTLPDDPPAKNFWSLTIYDNRTRSQIDTPQQQASLSSYSPLQRNADGSLDLWLGPEPPAGQASNWIQTIPEQGFFAMFRLYGPLEAALNKTWQLNDIEEIT